MNGIGGWMRYRRTGEGVARYIWQMINLIEMKGRTTPTAGSGIIVFQLKGVKRTRGKITEYADPLTVITVSLTAEGVHRRLCLVLRDDARAFFETGGDEIRITDFADEQPSTLKFGGRFRFEWRLEGKPYASFALDSFELVE